MTTPSSLLSCPADAITLTAPADDLRIATGGGQAIVGVLRDGVLRWAVALAPAPLRLIADTESVGYHRMWSGVIVELPVWEPLCVWFCDGEDQVLQLRLDEADLPELILP